MTRTIPISRRSALAGGLAAAGALAAPALTRALGGSEEGRPLPVLPELAMERDGDLVRAALDVASREIDIAGRPVELMTYAGGFPGPVIRLRRADTLELTFANRLDEPTNLHTHGLAVSPEGEGDNPFRYVGAGETVHYRFALGDDPRNTGLFWYHPHLQGNQAEQLFRGLAGPIVVDGPEDIADSLGPHEERVIVLKDLRLGEDGVRLHGAADWINGLEGELALLNGMVRPVLEARERRLRLRLINASNARYWRLTTEPARDLHIVALDGHVLAAPWRTSEVSLAPAERIDLVVDLEPGEPLWLVDRPVPRRTSFGRRAQKVLRILPPRGGTARPDPLPARRDTPWSGPAGREIAEERPVVFSLFYINGQGCYGRPGDAAMFTPRLGSYEIWEVSNVDSMDHPFHLHTWPFFALSRNGRPVPGTPLRDTVNLAPGERMRIGVAFDGNPGRSVFHCHIVEHAEKGMMAILEVTA